MNRPTTLSATFLKNVRQPGRYGDGHGGHGLSLLVTRRANGRLSKRWTQRVHIDGKYTSLGLGVWPAVTLAEARRRAIKNRQALEEGRNPRGKNAPTFREAAEQVIELRIPTWRNGGKSSNQWRQSFERYAYPIIGDKSVARIGTADVLKVLAPHWNQRSETMRRVKQRIGAVLGWSVAAGHRTDNPARGPVIESALPRVNGKTRQRALPHAQVPEALRTVEASGAYRSTILATKFLTLTATRSGEARLATWPEIDLEARIWTVLGERTKTGRPFRVPLSKGAVEVLEESRERWGADGLIFPSVTGRALSDSTISKLFRENNIGCVPHGMRSSFRDWCGENSVPREVAEQALSHVVPGVEGSYARSDLLEVRRPIMEKWAGYLLG